jgi:ribose transport system substrate-binding protein
MRSASCFHGIDDFGSRRYRAPIPTAEGALLPVERHWMLPHPLAPRLVAGCNAMTPTERAPRPATHQKYEVPMKNTLSALAISLAMVMITAGCGSTGTGSSGQNSSVSAQIDAKLAALKGKLTGTDPNGVAPQGFSATTLTDKEVADVKALHLKAAIAMHYTADGWSQAQLAGLKSEFARLGIDIVASTDAEFSPAKQVANIETSLAHNPDILVSLPTDPVALAAEYRKASAAGVKLVFMDNIPKGYAVGTDYVSMVSDDRFTAGEVSGYQLAKAIGGKGKVGLIFHDADFFVTHQSYLGVKKALAEFPDIKIVAEKGVVGPDFAGDAQAATNALLTKYPNLDGIWAVWDLPAEGVMAGARAAGRQDVKISTIGLGNNAAVAIGKSKLIVGLAAQRPYDQGVAEADLGAAAKLGKTHLPGFIASEALPVDHSNVLDAWKLVYHVPAPSDVTSAFVK